MATQRTYQVTTEVHIDDYHATDTARFHGIQSALVGLDSIRLNWHTVRVEDAKGPDPEVVYLRVRVEG